MPQSLQGGYVDGGDTLQWAPTGEAFEIYWNGPSPCSSTDSMTSNGTNPVTCHTLYGGGLGGNFVYDVDVPNKPTAPSHTGVYMMHVGQCTQCPGSAAPPPGTPPTTTAPHANAASAIVVNKDDEVRISCPASGSQTKVESPTGPAGLNKGDEVAFKFKGRNPIPPLHQFTIQFDDHGYCSNLKTGYIQDEGPSCIIAKAATTGTYHVTSAACSDATASLKTQ